MIQTFYSILNTVNLNILLNHSEIFTWRLSPDHCRGIKLWKFLFIFQRLCHVQFFLRLTLTWGIDILFDKLTRETRVWIWKTHFAVYFRGWRFYTKPVFFFNNFSGDLHFDASFLGLCKICPIICPTHGESKICLLVCWWRRVES